MSERGKRKRSGNKTIAYIAAAIVHALIIGALFVNFTQDTETVEAAYAEKVDVVRATTIDASQIKKQEDLLKLKEQQKQREKEREEQRLKDLQAQAQKEKDQIEALKKQQEQEKEKAAELEEERKALALKRKKEEEQREKELAEQKKREEQKNKEAEEAAQKKKLADEQKRQEELAKAEREKQDVEMQRQLQEQMAREEAFLAEQMSKERTTTLVQKHLALIGEKIKGVRTLDPGTERWRKTLVNIKVSPSGEVRSVRTIESSGSPQYDRSVETAVYKASPLPIPDAVSDDAANRKFWDFEFLVKVVD